MAETEGAKPAVAKAETLERTRRVIAKVGFLSIEKVTAETAMADHFDSLECLEVIMALESEFCLDPIPDAEADKIRTVRDVADLVERLKP